MRRLVRTRKAPERPCSAFTISGSSSFPACCSTSRLDPIRPISSAAACSWDGAAVLGISAGCLVHVFAAAIGLSALLAASSAAFTFVKWAGAAYLCFIGVKMLLSRPPAPAEDAAAGSGAILLRQVFLQGAMTNALNPKVALFFLAFLPQFVVADPAHKAAAFVLLGLIFIFNGTLWCLGVAAFAAGAAGRIGQSAPALLWINRALGGLFVYLGAGIAMLQAR